MSFSKLGLSTPILTAVAEQGYQNPTAIQAQAIPVILAGKDLLGAAQTGTGKTASFVLPLLERLSHTQTNRAKRIRALILTPTRELAIQVEANITNYGKHLSLTSMAMYGGVDSEIQKQRLIEGVDILVATPGRLLDMAHQRAVQFDELQTLVLDEADRMLDMGFIADINKIIERLPPQRQNLLFSATLSDEIRLLAKTSLSHAVEVTIAPTQSTVPNIDQWLVTVDKDKKSALLSHLITTLQWDQALIFIKTKHGAAKLVSQLEKRGIKAEAIHSGRSQAVRSQLLAAFKSGELPLLVATGVAARGIDIDSLSRVINYDLPDEADDYIHRIGRTGRAGLSGEAISFVSKDDFRNLCTIESRLESILTRKEVEGFAPTKEVPTSILNYVPQKRRSTKKGPSKNRHSGDQQSSLHEKRSKPEQKPTSGQRKPKQSTKKNVNKKIDPWKR